MDTIDKIKELSKETGISQSYICNQLGVRRTYLAECAAGKLTIPPDRLSKIADILGTTPEYLKGETDQKEKPSVSRELTKQEEAILDWFRSLPEDTRQALITISKGSLNKE